MRAKLPRTKKQWKAWRKRSREESQKRGLERRELALAIGNHILNTIEITGSYHIRNYLRIRPKSVINYYKELTDGK